METRDKPVSQKELLTVQEAAQFLGMGRSRTYEKVKSGEIPSMRLSPRRIRISIHDLRTYAAKHQRP